MEKVYGRIPEVKSRVVNAVVNIYTGVFIVVDIKFDLAFYKSFYHNIFNVIRVRLTAGNEKHGIHCRYDTYHGNAGLEKGSVFRFYHRYQRAHYYKRQYRYKAGYPEPQIIISSVNLDRVVERAADKLIYIFERICCGVGVKTEAGDLSVFQSFREKADDHGQRESYEGAPPP